MSTKVKSVRLVNYCGYRNTTFDFTDANGEVKDFAVFFGPNGIGKCVLSTCYITTYGNMVQIGSIFDRSKLPVDEGWMNLDAPIMMGINGTEGVCRRLYYSGRKPSITVTTSSGYTLTGSRDRHMVLAPVDGTLGFKLFKDTQVGDMVAVSRRSVFPDSGGASEAEAMLLGYLVSEGYVAAPSGVVFFNSDKEVIADYERLHLTVIGSPPTTRERRQDNLACFTSECDRHVLDRLGLTRTLSGDHSVPSSVLGGTRSAVCAFLRTYFEGDGGVEQNTKLISCASKSYRLMHEVHLMLLRLGIVSSLSEKFVKKLTYVDKPYTSWRICIQGEDVLRYARAIGFVSSRKQRELDDLLISMATTERNPNKDVIPAGLFRPIAIALQSFRDDLGIEFSRKDYKTTSNGLHCLQPNYIDVLKTGVSKKKIEACVHTLNERISRLNASSGGVAIAEEIDLNEMTGGFWSEDYFFDTVASIEKGEDELFDLEVEEHHRYWTNGFISHNSTVLDAIRMGANPNLFGRGSDDPQDRHASLMRKYIHDIEYIPSVDAVQTISKVKNPMEIEVAFATDSGDKRVVLDNLGLKLNELPPCSQRGGYVFFGDADHPMSTQKFMLAAERAETFLEFCEEVYGYECILGSPVKVQGIGMYTDFMIQKGDVRVHFKRMSAGERKIATLVSDLCQPINTSGRDIILVDNVEMHIYWKRHNRTIDKLRSCFPGKQIITTTHSSIVIDHVKPEFRYDLEQYRPDYKLFDGVVGEEPKEEFVNTIPPPPADIVYETGA